MHDVPPEMTAIEITEPGGPEVLRATRRTVPDPAAGDVLSQVGAAGVNRPDVMQRRGQYPPPPGASDIPGLETFEGTGAYGDVYSAPVDVVGWLEDKRKLVRNKDGQEVVSMSQFMCDNAHLDKFTPDSRVTLPRREAFVIGVADFNSGDLDLPDHLEIDLT